MKKIFARSGYTIVEMMVAMGAMTVLSVAIAGVFNASQDALSMNYNHVTLQTGLRKLLLVMTQDIREANINSNPAISTGPGTITFQIQQSGAWVTYNLAGGAVTRAQDGQVQTLAGDITGLNFTYNPADANPLLRRTISIQITGQRSPLRRRNNVNMTERVTGDVTLRN